jgi:uncharacterized protein (TIGR03435 family)
VNRSSSHYEDSSRHAHPPEARPSPILRALAATLLTFALASQAQAQEPTVTPATNQPPASFEVASISPIDPSHAPPQSLSPYGTPYFTAENFSLEDLIKLAYDVDEQYLSSSDKEIYSLRFGIHAKTVDDLPLTYERLRPLLQKLLADRFQLAAHFEDKEISGYALTVIAKGSALKSADEKGGAAGYILQDAIQLPGQTMDIFARVLAGVVHRPVENQTSLPGHYNISLKYAAENSIDSPYPDIFTSLKEQLGLQLISRKVTAKMLVVDHVTHQPTEN